MSDSETLKSTEFDKMIDENFFYPALFVKDDKGFRDCIRETMENGTISLKNLVIFLRKKQNELEKKFYILPIELLNEEEFPDSEIEKLEEDYSQTKKDGGYIRFLLEKIYDLKFKKELNKEHKNYFKTDTNLSYGFDYDFVGDYLKKIKDADFDCSKLTDKKELRARKYKDEGKTVERIDNLFTLFKCYAQGEYSKILIALNNNEEFSNKNPEMLRPKGFDVILNDDAIKDFIPPVRYLPEEEKCKINDYYQVLTFERQETEIIKNLQRWFDDFVPSDLDREYEKFYGKVDVKGAKLKQKSNGATLRKLLETGCKRISDETKRIPANQIKKVYEEGNIFSGSQISQIKKLYEKYYGKNTEYKTVREKIELIRCIIEESERKKKSWQEIIERYKRTYLLSLDSAMCNEDGDESSLYKLIEDDKKKNEEIIEEEINRIVSSYHFERYADKLFDLFLREFSLNHCFIEAVAKKIQNYENLESIYLSEIPLPVIYNSVQGITKMITKNDISQVSEYAEVFHLDCLKDRPFHFIEDQISKFRMIFLIEEWRYHHDHPWRQFWKDYKMHFPKKILDFDQFTKKMERIYSEVKSWK